MDLSLSNRYDGDAPITGFKAAFKLLIGNGDGADGFSFNLANDLPNDVIPEGGAGSGLTVAFDTFDNGGGEAPAIDVVYGGITVASTKGIGPLFRTGAFVDVRIELDPEGYLNLQVGATPVYDRLLIGFIPLSGRFGMGARTGASTDDHLVDDLTIETFVTLPAGPHLRSASPVGFVSRGDPTITLIVQDGAVTQLNPSTVELLWNGTTVSPNLSRAGDLTTIRYAPPGLLAPGAVGSFQLSFADTGSPAATKSYQFSFVVAHYIGPNGNFYEFVQGSGSTWGEARLAAEQRASGGRAGHLATITDADEDMYLEKLRQECLAGEAWVGGFQQPNQLTPMDGWFWINNEGPIPGVNGGVGFSDWTPGEPNDCCITSGVEDNEEDHLTIGIVGFGWNDNGYCNSYLVEYEVPIVSIDIKPGDSSNVINLQSNGKIPVAILSTESFDAATINTATVRFGHSGTEAAPASYALADVNGDRRNDLVCQFYTQETGFLRGDTVGRLQATPFGGSPIKGSDTITLQHCPSLALGMQAFQNVRQETDVYFAVSALEPEVAAPSLAQHLQLKSFDLFGELRWTDNQQSLTLSPNAPQSSSAVVQYPDLLHYQKLAAQMEVKSSQGKATQVLRAETRVLRRPDLAITGLEAPASVTAQQIVNFTASVAELNGDLGAKATLYLMEGSQTLDAAHSVALGPRGQAMVVFSAIFQQIGAHQLKVVIGDVQPGDYDQANNAGEFTLEVLPQPPTYCAFYQHMDHELWQESDNDYAAARYYENGTVYDFFQFSLNFNGVALRYPISYLRFALLADGLQSGVYELFDVVPTSVFSYGDCVSYQTSRPVFEDGTALYIQSYSCAQGGVQQSYLSFSRQTYEYVFFSETHYKLWGPTDESSSGTAQLGHPLNARQSVDTQFVIEDQGQNWQGTIHLSVWSNPIDNEWNQPGYRCSEHGMVASGNDCGVVK